MNRRSDYKDLEKWRKTKRLQQKRYYDKHAKVAINSRERYTEEEIEMILNHEISDVELSKKIGRSVKAIQIKRCKLKAVEQ